MTELGVPVAEPPTDGISALRFASNSNLLLAASWDGVSRINNLFYCTATTIKLQKLWSISH
jgi:hypothetical protein